LFVKTIDRLRLYASTQYKNVSDVTKCLMNERLVKPEVPKLPDYYTAHENRVWEHHVVELMNTKRV